MSSNYLNINRNLWDKKTEIHFDSDFYDVNSFKKGKDSLNSIEIELLGDIRGKTILHLQCHFGQDTISLARLGAQATGVDFSTKAIEKAIKLSDEMGTSAKFIVSDIYDLPRHLDEQFDIVFTSYGVIGWLPDLKKWGEIINHFLKPGGVFVMAEFHPVVWMFDSEFKNIEFKYMDAEPIVEEEEGTYADKTANIKEASVCWNHGISTVLKSILKTGLEITDFNEYDYSPYDCFENTVLKEKRKYQIRGLEEKIPMVFSLKAKKPR